MSVARRAYEIFARPLPYKENLSAWRMESGMLCLTMPLHLAGERLACAALSSNLDVKTAFPLISEMKH